MSKARLAPVNFPVMPKVSGVRLAALSAHIRDESLDTMLVVLDEETQVAGVFTRSKTASAPVHWCRGIISRGQARGLIVNSGNANAFTGYAGTRAVAATTAAFAQAIGCRADQIFVGSTGVIGEPLPVEKILENVDNLVDSLRSENWCSAAHAICTTDTYPKGITVKYTLDGNRYVLNAIAKGSGMIAPDMGTMLCFLFTDAAIPAPVLSVLVRKANEISFNAITVDSDTSTSDTVLLFATGRGKPHDPVLSSGDPRLNGFKRALRKAMINLCHQIVRDGEGARKFVTINVRGASSRKAAKQIGMSIANSPLVKTAIAGEDPNWGRIVMAVGKSGERADRDSLSICLGNILVAENGKAASTYSEVDAEDYMRNSEIDISVDVGIGRGKFTVWTCDLTERYIEINADYRS